MNSLYDKLPVGGYVIADDYHVVQPAKMAVHDFAAARQISPEFIITVRFCFGREKKVVKQEKQQVDVCFVSHSSQKAGSERSLLELLEGLVKDGVLCHVLLPENGPIEADLKRLSVSYSVISYRWWTLGKDEDRQKAIEEIAQQSVFVTEEISRLNPRLIYSNTSVINPNNA